MTASNQQIGGTHYKDMGDFQPWDVLTHWLTPEEYRGYQKGVAVAYLARERAKGGNEDIKKAIHHLQKLIEVDEVLAVVEPQAKPENVAVGEPKLGDDWISWTGGECPLEKSVNVEIMIRNGKRGIGKAGYFYWVYDIVDVARNIIAYRVVK